jgi:3-hydroxyisobutyrate dehydrogenase-like beta-hydroxyacid dehydrogenase
VAILGTGRMGAAFARRLADLQPTLWNRTKVKAEQLGVGRVVATPAEAVRNADIVITSLTDAEAVRTTYRGRDGALAAAHGQVFVEMSTSGPELVAELDPQVRATGSTLIDAPVLGAPSAVVRGGAAILAGGAEADLERALPVLRLLGEIHHVGPLGNGARLKLVANSMLATIALAAAELQTAGEAASLNPKDVFWVLARLAPALEMRRSGYLDRRHEPTLFAVRDLRKDLDLALELFQRSNADAPLITLVNSLVGEVVAEAGDLDITALITRYGQGAGADQIGG